MEAVDYLKEKARMCEENTCYDCRLTFGDWDRKSPCLDTERDKSEQAVTIVEKWAKENPVKTYELKECCEMECIDCWNREYKEEI
jgi:hypothetical protein